MPNPVRFARHKLTTQIPKFLDSQTSLQLPLVTKRKGVCAIQLERIMNAVVALPNELVVETLLNQGSDVMCDYLYRNNLGEVADLFNAVVFAAQLQQTHGSVDVEQFECLCAGWHAMYNLRRG